MLARAAERRIGDFNAEDLANTAWAFAAAGFPNAESFEVLAMAAERHDGDFTAQRLAITARAFAFMGGSVSVWLDNEVIRKSLKRLNDEFGMAGMDLKLSWPDIGLWCSGKTGLVLL